MALEIKQLSPLHSPRPRDLIEWEITVEDPQWISADSQKTPFMIIREGNEKPVRRAAFIFQAHRTDPDHRQGEYRPLSNTTLRVRYSPRTSGTLRWQLFPPQSDPQTTPAIAADRMVVLNGHQVGGAIRQAPFNKRLLATPDGQVFIPIGPNIAWALGQDRLAQFITYLDKLEAVGGNHIRIWCSSWFGQIEHQSEPGTWRLDQAWLLDAVLAACRERGIYVTLVLDNHHDFIEGKSFPYGTNILERALHFFGPELAETYKQRLHYLIARYGADDHILAWELFNEIDLTGVERYRLVNWARQAATFFTSVDPFERLVSISWAGDDWPEMREVNEINLFQVHRYLPPMDDIQGNDYDILATMVADSIPLLDDDHPFIFAEVGHQGANEANNPGNKIDTTGLILVHKAWTGFLLGGAGYGMNWWWDSWIDKNDLWKLYKPMGSITEKLNWLDPALKPMRVPLDGDLRVIGWQAPQQALIWPQSLSDNWHQQLITKIPNQLLGKRLAVTMNAMEPTQTFSIKAYDMFSGDVTLSESATTDQQGRLIVRLPPHTGNQVVVIKLIR